MRAAILLLILLPAGLAGCAAEEETPPTRNTALGNDVVTTPPWLTPTATAPPATTPSTTPTATTPATTPPATTPASPPGEADAPLVEVRSFQFRPPELSVPADATVRFRNLDAAAHTATADDGSFDVALEGSGGEGEATLATPGTYPYYCKIHTSMRGTITVA